MRLGYSPARVHRRGSKQQAQAAPHLVAAEHPLWAPSVRNIEVCLGVNSSALDALLAATPPQPHEAEEYRDVRLRSFYARKLLPDDMTADLLLPPSQRGRRVMRSSLQEVFRRQLQTARVGFNTATPAFRVLAWCSTRQGRKLFLPGLGKFDVREAYMDHWAACQEADDVEDSPDPLHALLPTPFDLQKAAYLRYFENVRGPEARARIVQLLACAASNHLTGNGVGRDFAPRYLVRFHKQFDDDAVRPPSHHPRCTRLPLTKGTLHLPYC